MLQVSGIAKFYGRQTLFEEVSFSLTRGEKVGLVGRNGSGKTTLFRMILKEVEPDAGSIAFPKGYHVGTLPQHIHFTKPTLLEEGCLALKPDEEYDHYKVERILFGLGFSEEDLQKDPKTFSGGFQIRINLTKALVQNPDILLLDEPTNYLDIISQRWLKQYLKSYPGEIIIISHDREFMDSVTTHIMGIHRQKLKKVEGNTFKYYERIREDEEIYAKTLKNQEAAKKHLEKYISRFRASARRASQAQSRMKQLAKFEDLKELREEQSLDFSFNYAPCPGKVVMSVQGLSFAYDPQVNLIQNLSFSIGKKDRVGIIGKNGKGKSTLLNLLSGELKPVAGHFQQHPSIKMGHFGQTNILRLNETHTVVDEIAASNFLLTIEQVRTICGIMMFSQDLAHKKIAALSGGEKSRVLLGKILANSANLLLLDEPTNHLDQESIEALMEGLEAFEGAVVIVTHNEMILNRLCNKLVVFHRGRVEFIDGNYKYFLDKFGWDSDAEMTETNKSSVQPSSKVIPSKKEKRKLRSDIIQSRSKELNPLKKKIETLEAEISRLEADVARANEEMATASQNKDISTFVTLSKGVKQNQKVLEKNYKRLETLSAQFDKKQKQFNEELEGSELPVEA